MKPSSVEAQKTFVCSTLFDCALQLLVMISRFVCMVLALGKQV